MFCPYCGKESVQEEKATCYFCNKELGDEYVLIVDEVGETFSLCSVNCMDSLFESMEIEEEEEEF